MGPKVGRKRSHHSIRDNSRRSRTRARTRDLDLIHKDLATNAPVATGLDLPGMGLNYCKHCARHFISDAALLVHMRTKLHKKRVKVLLEEPYTQREADAAAGLF